MYLIKKLKESVALKSGLGILAGLLVALFLLPGLRMGWMPEQNFLPHATCYLQDRRIIALYATTDSLIGLAYLAIAGILGYLVYKARRDIPFHWIVAAFGLFIVTCGFTHIMAVINIWKPLYWLSGDVKIITATTSVATAIALPFVVPRIFATIRAAKLSNERQEALEEAHAELKELYSRVRQVDELKTQFFANVSHELRTPLTLIMGPAQKLSASAGLTDEEREEARGIYRNGQRLLRQVNDLLEVSRLEAGRQVVRYEAIDAAELVRTTVAQFSPLARERGIDLKAVTPGELEIEADGDKFDQIMLNLLGNAVKFVPDGGRVTASIAVEGDQVVLAVEDSGAGVPEEKREEVFERFAQADGGSTRRKGGTGLGLAIVRGFADLHHGKVEVDRSPELGGARFVLTLPRWAPSGETVEPRRRRESPSQVILPAEGRTAPSPETFDPSRPVILLVEDDPEMRRFVATVLGDLAQVALATNGREGLVQAEALAPDLIVSDIMMPEMSGDQMVEAIRRKPRLAEVPVLLLSAKADDDLRLRLLREGAQDYVVKPFAMEELHARVSNLLSMSRTRRALREELRHQQGDLAAMAREVIARKQAVEAALQAQEAAEKQLRQLNEELEGKVRERTEQLEGQVEGLESFARTVSHDLRSPLRTVASMTQVLVMDGKLDEDGQKIAKMAANAAMRMAKMIDDLLELSRVGRQEVQASPLVLKTICGDVVKSFAADIERKQAEVSLEVGDIRVLAHQTLLTQVVGNLLGNALKFVPKGQTPRVRIWAEGRPEHRVRLWVEDKGIGIAEEDREKIFQAFSRLHSVSEYEGTGLGLAILSRAVARMNGTCGVESEPGAGSRFWLELPAEGDRG